MGGTGGWSDGGDRRLVWMGGQEVGPDGGDRRLVLMGGQEVGPDGVGRSFTATELDRPIRDPPPWREGGKSGTISPGAVHKPVAACVVELSSAESDTPVTSEAPTAAETLVNIEERNKGHPGKVVSKKTAVIVQKNGNTERNKDQQGVGHLYLNQKIPLSIRTVHTHPESS
ncbi:hypothetical protein F7725_016243 [Dissostichus mawsoni]|uniref:Uncharacterized protein n=1 Tax=Dissostichus mawsoni TaxID=36200 RepID=A0A7J5Z1G4_DISMA|nr:hypothetical protein F7725_016243 [Dissostichus mawsoni]